MFYFIWNTLTQIAGFGSCNGTLLDLREILPRELAALHVALDEGSVLLLVWTSPDLLGDPAFV